MRIFLSIIMVLALATASFAAQPAIKQAVPFSNASGASAAVKYSEVYNATYFPNKTLHYSGVTLTSTLASPTFKNMSGTLLAQCAPAATGPWSTCVLNNYAQTAVSATTNGSFTWRDISSYVRFKWTSGTVGGKLKAWLNLSE
jgi:hypothetical protein